tara:strand:+ start:1329 stop:1508 length:180 start_codon:yes stop_codon:yes gene_type:complete
MNKLEEENKMLKKENEELKKFIIRNIKKYQKLKKENDFLFEENQSLIKDNEWYFHHVNN